MMPEHAENHQAETDQTEDDSEAISLKQHRWDDPHIKIGVVCLILAVLAAEGAVLYARWTECTSLETLNMSITVIDHQNFAGLTGDRDSLKFGVVSPETIATRSVAVNHSREANVTVFTEGDFSSWVNVGPSEFFIENGKTQEVFFWVSVPPDALPGNYTGRVLFCFKDR